VTEPSNPGAADASPDADNSGLGGDAFRYDFDITLESESTHARVVRMVGADRRVLELGPAAGYMTKAFADNGCRVVGIEIDEQMAAAAEPYCERMIVADLDRFDIEAELQGERFDAIVAADVLEHLARPDDVLRRLIPLLEEDGFVVASLPNVAHGSVRLALLEGHFSYQEVGLLDRTHLRFFTRESIADLFDEAELAIVELHRQELNIEASEVRFERESVPAEVIEELSQDIDARTYQFVVKAVPLYAPGMRALQERFRELATIAADAELELANVRRIDLAGAAEREAQLRSALVDLHDALLGRDETIQRINSQHEQSEERIAELTKALTVREDEARRLRIRLDRILQSPPARVYEKLKRLPIVRGIVARRSSQYDQAVDAARRGAD
jgi:2-polyprenyl-3-methyl-5-hydroxy-6-metoxy-1,4-benzoquinol methylase